MQLNRSFEFNILKWHCDNLNSHQTIILLLQSERLNKQTFTLQPPLSSYHTYQTLPLATTCPLTVSENV